jgi:PAP2 superfamily C-terminal
MSTSTLLQSGGFSFREQFFEFNLSTSHRRVVFIIRAGLVLLLTMFTISNALTAWAIQPNEVSCLYDGIFEITTPINHFFIENEEPRNSLLILSSFFIDFLLMWFAVRYALWGKSSRQLIFFFLFYLTRAFIQSFFLMRVPDGYCWDYPGFPSLAVSYHKTSDFFYSGHVGVMLFCALENKHLGNSYMMWVSVFVCVSEFFIMIVLRGHYSIDLISGLVFSHYYWIISGWLCIKVDKKLKLDYK